MQTGRHWYQIIAFLHCGTLHYTMAHCTDRVAHSWLQNFKRRPFYHTASCLSIFVNHNSPVLVSPCSCPRSSDPSTDSQPLWGANDPGIWLWHWTPPGVTSPQRLPAATRVFNTQSDSLVIHHPQAVTSVVNAALAPWQDCLCGRAERDRQPPPSTSMECKYKYNQRSAASQSITHHTTPHHTAADAESCSAPPECSQTVAASQSITTPPQSLYLVVF